MASSAQSPDLFRPWSGGASPPLMRRRKPGRTPAKGNSISPRPPSPASTKLNIKRRGAGNAEGRSRRHTKTVSPVPGASGLKLSLPNGELTDTGPEGEKLFKAKVSTDVGVERFGDGAIDNVQVHFHPLKATMNTASSNEVTRQKGAIDKSGEDGDTPQPTILHVPIKSRENDSAVREGRLQRQDNLVPVLKTQKAGGKLWGPWLPLYEKSTAPRSTIGRMPQLLTRRQTTEVQRSVAGFLPSSPPQRRNMRSPSARNRKLTERQLGKAIHNEDRRFGNSKSRGSVRKNIAPQILARLRGKIRFSKPSRGGNAAPTPQALKGKRHSSLSVHVHMNNAMFIEEGDALKNYKTFLARPPSGPTVLKPSYCDRHVHTQTTELKDPLPTTADENSSPCQDKITSAYNESTAWLSDDEDADEATLDDDQYTSSAILEGNFSGAVKVSGSSCVGESMDQHSVVTASVEEINFDKAKQFMPKPAPFLKPHQKRHRPIVDASGLGKTKFNFKYVGGDTMDINSIVEVDERGEDANAELYPYGPCVSSQPDKNAFERVQNLNGVLSPAGYVKPNLPHPYTVQQVVPTMNRRNFAYTFPDWDEVNSNIMSPRTLEDVIELRLSKWLDPQGEYSPRRNPVNERERVIQRHYDDTYLNMMEEQISKAKDREKQARLGVPVPVAPTNQHEIYKAKQNNEYYSEARLSGKIGALAGGQRGSIRQSEGVYKGAD